MHDLQPVPPGSTVAIAASFAGFGPATRGSIDAGVDAPGERGYHPGLPTWQLITEVRGLLATERRAERLVCRYLADLADRVQARQDAELGAYADEFHAARCCFGLGARDTRERVRIGRALRQLPRIERAFIDGDLSYSRVREVTRVATVHNEADWLEFAQTSDMRSLERRVATAREATGANGDSRGERRVATAREAAGGNGDSRGERRVDNPVRTEWTGPGTVRVTFELSSEAWTLLERAMREARGAGSAGFSDADALEAVARAALSVQAQRTDVSDSGCPMAAYEWPTSGHGEPDTGAGTAELGRSTAAARGCGAATRGATELGLGTEGTRGGSAAGLGTEATQGGSGRELGEGKGRGVTALELDSGRTRGVWLGDSIDQGIDDERIGVMPGERAVPCQPTVRLIQVMGRCGGWSLEALTEASGLSVQEVSVALTLLELGGRVRRRAFAFDPV